jgi:uncharacterized phage-associated protein
MAAITADQAAEFLVALSQDAGDPVTNLKLQKLLYYAQAWYLVIYGKPLFDDRIEAWPHGPVVPRVYGRFKHYRWEPIVEEIKAPELPQQIRDHLIEVMQVFGVYTAYQLERMTHQEAPWKDVRGDLAPDDPSNAIIRPESMREFFSRVLENA